MNNSGKNIAEEPVVIFVHIPKTAGTTLRHIIQYQFQPNNIFEFYRLKRKPHKGIDEFNSLPEAQKKAIKFISGHRGFGLHEFLLPPHTPYTYITILREPVERVLSYYYFLQARKSNIVQDKTLEDFVRMQRTKNSMTNYLSGVVLKRQLVNSSIDSDSVYCSNEMLELAKKNLKEHFKVVGLLERFDETCLLLKKALGWNIPLCYVKTNVSKKRSLATDIPKTTLRLIEENNELDLQLYEYAKEVFEELIHQQGASFEEELTKSKLVNESTQAKINFKISSSYKRVVYRMHEVLAR